MHYQQHDQQHDRGRIFVPPPAMVTLTYNPVAPSNTAYFNCTATDPSLPPSPSNPCTNPNAHQVNLAVPAVSTQFNLVVLKRRRSRRCKPTEFAKPATPFSPISIAASLPISPAPPWPAVWKCRGGCVRQRRLHFLQRVLHHGWSYRTEPDPSWYTPPVTWNIAFNDDNNTPPAGYSSSERLYDDPDYEPSPTTPYGTNCAAFMVTGTPPGSCHQPVRSSASSSSTSPRTSIRRKSLIAASAE